MGHYTEDQLEDIEFAIKVSSEVYGNEFFVCDSAEEREARLARLSKRIEKLDDEIEREIFYVDHGDDTLVAEWNGEDWDSHVLKEEQALVPHF